jgi:hypothetical protein
VSTLMLCSTIPLVGHYATCKVVHKKSHHRYVPHSVATQTSYDTECNSSVLVTAFRPVVFMFKLFLEGYMCADEEAKDKKKGK